MLPVVREAILPFTRPIEGWTHWMYLDEEGLVTTGLGDLIDPSSLAVAVNGWIVKATSAPATRQQVLTEWQRVKALQAHRKEGGFSPTFRDSAVLWLNDDGVQLLVNERLDLNETRLSKSFPGYVNWPADAQLALHSMAWAQGAAFRPMFPKFAAAVDQMQFLVAAGPPGDADRDPQFRGEAWISDKTNPGLRKRNLSNKILWTNAHVVMADALDPDVLYWPDTLLVVPPPPSMPDDIA